MEWTPRPVGWVILGAYSALMAYIQIGIGTFDDPWMFLWGLIFLVWTISPIAILVCRCESVICFVGAIVNAIVGAYFFVSIFLLAQERDAQDSLALIFIPLYQWGASGSLIVASILFKKFGLRDNFNDLP